MQTVGLVVADDHPLVLRGITECLASSPQFRILASCQDGKAALDAIQQFDPDVALLDIAMPRLTGLEVLAELTGNHHRTRVVFLTAHLDKRAVTTAIADGASALLLKECSPEELRRCILDVANGQRYFPLELSVPGQTKTAEMDMKGSPPVDRVLSEREWQVLKNAAEGRSNKEIARLLDITEGTVKVHLHQIFKKLGVTNRTALANFVYQYKT